MKTSWLAAVAMILCASCAHTGATHAQRAARAPQIPAFERQIQNAIDAGEGDYRIRLLRERVAAAPEDVHVRIELAGAYQERGYPELALEHCRLAAARFPDAAEAHLALAKTLRSLGRRDDAVRQLEAFLRAHPQKSPEYLAWLGLLRDEMWRLGEGEAAHRAALELDPKQEYLHNNLGYNLLLQGRRQEAAEEFRRALALHPGWALARNNLGLALASTPEQAVLNWQSISDPATAHNNLAAILIEQGRYEEARKELETALGYNRQHSAALNNLRLVSQLDGQPAAVRIQPAEARWERWKSALRRVLVGSDRQEHSTAGPRAAAEERRGL